jgi:hypothetical protein
MNQNTQLSKASGYDVNRIIFSKPQKNTIPNTKPAISYTRINISTKNRDGTVGDLIFETETLFSFGVCENTNPETGKVNGYVMPLCLWNKDFATPEEKAFTDTFDKVVEKVREHILDVRDDIEKYDLTENSDSIKKLNPLYWKKVKGKVVEGTGPTLYAKLIQSKKQDKIVTDFYDETGEEIDPLALVGKYCYVKGAVKIESIFVGKSISLQVKLYEAEVKVLDGAKKRLLPRPEVVKAVIMPEENENENDSGSLSLEPLSRALEDDTGSIKGSDDEEEAPEPAKKVVVKKVVKKAVKN